MTEQPERLLHVAQVAKRLDCCTETVRRYIKRGHLRAQRRPSLKRGSNFLIPESAVEEFIATSYDASRQPPV